MTTAVQPSADHPAGPPSGDGPGPSAAAVLLDAVRGNLRQYGMIIALAVIVVLFQIWTGNALLLPNNVSNIVQQNSYILILAMGMMIVIVAGHIDLSVGSLAAFTGAVAAVLMVQHHLHWLPALLLCLLIGAATGAWQGFWIAYVGIPSFIVTLAGMLLFRGATQIVLAGQSSPRSPGRSRTSPKASSRRPGRTPATTTRPC